MSRIRQVTLTILLLPLCFIVACTDSPRGAPETVAEAAGPAPGQKQVIAAESERPSSEPRPGWEVVEGAGERLATALKELKHFVGIRDRRIVPAAWKNYVGELQSVEQAMTGLELDLTFRVRSADADRLLVESVQPARGPLRLVGGRPAPIDRVMTPGVDEWSDFSDLLVSTLLDPFLPLNGHPPARLGAGWLHVEEDLTRAAFEGARVGSTEEYRFRCDGLVALYLGVTGSDGKPRTVALSVEAIAAGGVEQELARHDVRGPAGNRWGTWILSGSWKKVTTKADRYGRPAPSMADFLARDRPASDWACRTLELWSTDLDAAVSLLESVWDRGPGRLENAGNEPALDGLTTTSAKEQIRSPLSPQLAWINDAPLLRALWPDELWYTPDTYQPDSPKMTAEFWRKARGHLKLDLALLAVAGGSAEVFDLLTDDVHDPFVARRSLEGLTLAHLALLFGDRDVLQRLTPNRFCEEIRERIRYIESIRTDDDVPLGRIDFAFVNSHFDARPAWLRERYPTIQAVADAVRARDAAYEKSRRPSHRTGLGGSRRRGLEEDPALERYRRIFEDADAGLMKLDENGNFYSPGLQADFPGKKRSNEQQRDRRSPNSQPKPSWSFEGRPLRIKGRYGTVTEVSVVPFESKQVDRSVVSPSGLTPADLAALVLGETAVSGSIQAAGLEGEHRALAQPLVARLVRAIPSGSLPLHGKVRRNLASLRELRDRFIQARARESSDLAQRNKLRERLEAEWWKRPELWRVPGNPVRAAGEADRARPQRTPVGGDRRAQRRRG